MNTFTFIFAQHIQHAKQHILISRKKYAFSFGKFYLHQETMNGFHLPSGFQSHMTMVSSHQHPVPKGKSGQPVDSSYYKLLNVTPTSSTRDIRKAFRKCSLTHHPDKNLNDDASHAAFKQLTKVHEVLKDDMNRLCYDSFGPDFSEIKNIEMFKQNSRSDPIHAKVNLSMGDLLNGKTVTLRYKRQTANNSVTQETYDCFIAPGTPNGKKLVYEGKGHHENGKLVGDLVVVVEEEPHENCTRVGNSLMIKQRMPLSAALLGNDFCIHLPHGETTTIKPNGMFEPGLWYSVPCTEKTPFDVFVTFELIYPKSDFNEVQKELLTKVFNVVRQNKTNIIATEIDENDLQAKLRNTEQDTASYQQVHMSQNCPMQ